MRSTQVTAAAAGLMLLCSGPAIAQDPITVEPLTDRHTLTDDVGMQITLTAEGLQQQVVELDDASRVAVFEVTVQPGAMFPWHTHPGMSIGKITQGEFVYIYAEDCVERTYPAGTAFVDPGFDNVHMALNPHEEEETVIIASAFGVPADDPFTIPIDEDEAAALDEQCGIDRADPRS